jgi:predicted nucleic acid-binding protein
MTTALDTNVLSAAWNEDETLNRWATTALENAQQRGRLVICGVVHAELLAAAGRTEAFVDQFCEQAGIAVEWELAEKVWRAAGTAFQDYAARRKKQKGAEPRRILADFLIGAHALVSGYKLLTLDARIYKTAFPRLAVVAV